MVRDEVGDGEIRLVADRRDQRDRRRSARGVAIDGLAS